MGGVGGGGGVGGTSVAEVVVLGHGLGNRGGTWGGFWDTFLDSFWDSDVFCLRDLAGVRWFGAAFVFAFARLFGVGLCGLFRKYFALTLR